MANIFSLLDLEGRRSLLYHELFDHDTQQNPQEHLVIVADDIEHLWQGARLLVDIVLQTRNGDAEQWLLTVLRGQIP